MEFLPSVIQLAMGALAGFAAGTLLPSKNEGLYANIGIGVVGGLLFGQLLGGIVALVPNPGAEYISYIVSSLIGGTIGGAGALVLVGSFGKEPIGRA